MSIVCDLQGTSIAFTGNISADSLSQSITVSVDGGPPLNTSYTDHTPQSYFQWYKSPTLSEGKHIIKVDGLNGTSLDYATVTVGENTPLSRKKVIVDNDNFEAVHYSSGWVKIEEGFFPGENTLAGLPFGGSTHRSATPGDTITFLFSGQFHTSRFVFGMLTLHIRHVCSSLWTIRMGKHRYSRRDIHNRRRNLHGGILPCHRQLSRICQRRPDNSQLPIRFF